MPATRNKYDAEFRVGAVRIVAETGKPTAQVARDLCVNEGTLGHWCAKDRAEREAPRACRPEMRAEPERLRAEYAELRMAFSISSRRLSRRSCVSSRFSTDVNRESLPFSSASA